MSSSPYLNPNDFFLAEEPVEKCETSHDNRDGNLSKYG